MVNVDDGADGVRLDIWLDVACVFRTRSEAQKACRNNKVDVNGQPAKPNRRLRVGDKLEISRPFGRKQRLEVRARDDHRFAGHGVPVLADPSSSQCKRRRNENVFVIWS